jgi:hypothetical protein
MADSTTDARWLVKSRRWGHNPDAAGEPLSTCYLACKRPWLRSARPRMDERRNVSPSQASVEPPPRWSADVVVAIASARCVRPSRWCGSGRRNPPGARRPQRLHNGDVPVHQRISIFLGQSDALGFCGLALPGDQVHCQSVEGGTHLGRLHWNDVAAQRPTP